MNGVNRINKINELRGILPHGKKTIELIIVTTWI